MSGSSAAPRASRRGDRGLRRDRPGRSTASSFASTSIPTGPSSPSARIAAWWSPGSSRSAVHERRRRAPVPDLAQSHRGLLADVEVVVGEEAGEVLDGASVPRGGETADRQPTDPGVAIAQALDEMLEASSVPSSTSPASVRPASRAPLVIVPPMKPSTTHGRIGRPSRRPGLDTPGRTPGSAPGPRPGCRPASRMERVSPPTIPLPRVRGDHREAGRQVGEACATIIRTEAAFADERVP